MDAISFSAQNSTYSFKPYLYTICIQRLTKSPALPSPTTTIYMILFFVRFKPVIYYNPN